MDTATEPVTGLNDDVRQEGTMQIRVGTPVLTPTSGRVYSITIPLEVTDTTVSETVIPYEWSGSINLDDPGMGAYINNELATKLDAIRVDLNQRRAAAEEIETTGAELAAAAQAALDAILAA